ncbi:MAG TPA: phosphodiesterase [Acidimicrobiales bacterium]|nr:phosphodiesterase [Acidimicrobiales bacterium]
MDRWERRLAAAARTGVGADGGDGPDLHVPGLVPELEGQIHPDEVALLRELVHIASERPEFRAELPVLVHAADGVVSRRIEVVNELMGPVVRPARVVIPVVPVVSTGEVRTSSRSEVLEHLGDELAASGKEGVGVLLLDIDRFKMHNDALGDVLGDELLARLTDCVARTADEAWVRYLGGDEIVAVVSPAPDPAELVTLAERVRAAVAEPVELGDRMVAVTATVGVAHGVDGRAAAGLLRDADTALFSGKDRGRDRVEVFGRRLEARVARRLAGAQWLRRMLDEHAVELHYQPVVSLETGMVVGVEALLRVHAAADDRTVSPAALVDAAEDIGLIAPLGHLVVEQTVAQLAEWESLMAPGRRFSASVNVSPLQLAAPGFAEGVIASLEKAGVAAHRLSLEITGSTLIVPDPAVDAALSDLADLGVALGIDELGADRSSLGALRRFPLQFMKIDRSLVNGVDGDERDEAIVASAVGLAHQLGLRAIAVGVERADQCAVLRRLGCDAAQGYLFAPPLPPEELVGRL